MFHCACVASDVKKCYSENKQLNCCSFFQLDPAGFFSPSAKVRVFRQDVVH